MSTHLSGQARHRTAALWRHGVAFFVDALVPACVAAAFLAAGWFALPSLYEDPTLPLLERWAVTFGYGPTRFLSVLVLVHVPWLLWHATFAAFGAETPGARVAGIAYVDGDGLPAGGGRRLVRAALLLLFPLTLYWAALWVWFTPSVRSLADVLSGSVPVRARGR